MSECKWCNQTYERKELDDGFCSAQCRYDWGKKAGSMGLKKIEEDDKTRFSNALMELINFVRLLSKRHRLNPMEVMGVWMVAEETIMSSGANLEVAILLKEMKKAGLMPAGLADKADDKDPKRGYL